MRKMTTPMSDEDKAPEYAPPVAPDVDERWSNTQIETWRKDGARLRETLRPETIDHNVTWMRGYLKEFGYTEITADLLYVFWTTMPVWMSFIVKRTEVTCEHPKTCGRASLQHAADGMDFAAAILLSLEQHIGEEM